MEFEVKEDFLGSSRVGIDRASSRQRLTLLKHLFYFIFHLRLKVTFFSSLSQPLRAITLGAMLT